MSFSPEFKKFIFGTTVAILLVGLGFAVIAGLYWRRLNAQRSPSVTFMYEPVIRRNIERTVLTTGMLTPMTTVEVSSQISGLVASVNVDFNSPVKQGQPLAQIESSTYLQRFRQAEADLTAAEASHRLLELDAGRIQTLLNANMATKQDYDRASAQLQQAAATLLARQAAVENARLDLARCTLTSPIDGLVIYKAVEVGKTIAASLSAPTLFVIAHDLHKMRILAPVTEVDIGAVRVGQEVSFRVDTVKKRVFRGKLTQIRNPYTPTDSSNKPMSAPAGGISSFDCVIEVENPDLALRPGLNAVVSIVVESAADALCIPNSALHVKWPLTAGRPLPTRNGGDEDVTIYVVRGKISNSPPQPVRIKLGVSDGVATQIMGDINAGDTVVTGTSSL